MRLLAPSLLLASFFFASCTSGDAASTSGAGGAGGKGAGGSGASGAADIALAIDVTTKIEPGHLLARGRAHGGTVWFTLGPRRAIAPHLFGSSHKLGALRFSLQRLTEGDTGTRAEFAASLPARLAAIPELDWIASFASNGGAVLWNFMGTPSWLRDTGNVFTDKAKAACPNIATEPQWLPPTDYDLFATEVVQPIAAFVTKRFGPGQRFEAWNEPTSCTWFGTTDQFLALYAAIAKGVRLADPTAKVGGPSHSTDVAYGGTFNDPPGDARPFLQRWLEFGATHPGGRLPIDFVTLHAYEANPSANAAYHESELATLRGWLDASGYPSASTPIVNDEWNYGVYEDQTTNNVDTTPVDAAYFGATMLAFDAAGYDDQATQTFQDAGPDGSHDVLSPDFGTLRGLPRGGYFAAELAGKLAGDRFAATSDNPWVRVAAFGGAGGVDVLAASFAPYEAMSVQTAIRAMLRARPELGQKLAPVGQAVVDYLVGATSAVPPSIAPLLDAPETSALQDAKTFCDAENAMRARWGVGPKREDALAPPSKRLVLRVALKGLGAAPTRVTHLAVDATHAADQATLTAIAKELGEGSIPDACAAKDAAVAAVGAKPSCAALDAFCASKGATTTGLGADPKCALLELFTIELAKGAAMDATHKALADAAAPPAVTKAFDDAYAAFFQAYAPRYDAIYTRAGVAPLEEDVTARAVFANGELTLELEVDPFAVHLVRVAK